MKPLISFQGKRDEVFPYPDDPGQNIKFYPGGLLESSIYNSETFCISTLNGPYFLDENSATVDLTVGSTLNMRNILLHYGIADEHYVDCDMKHGFSGTPANFHGNFGTSANNPTDASIYISQRIATFFQAVLNGIAVMNGTQPNLGTDYFPDCENTRSGCTSKTTACTNCPN